VEKTLEAIGGRTIHTYAHYKHREKKLTTPDTTLKELEEATHPISS